MRAIQVPQRGGAFQVVERPTPEPGPKQVRVRVEACGVCQGENVMIQGHWHSPVQYPRIPGHEVIGRIDKLGSAVSGWTEGQRVGIGWSGGHDEVTGLTVDGGYAEYAVANLDALVSIPDGISPEVAAPLMCAGVTTFTALKHSQARMGDVVAVQGIGGLGHLAIQFARKAGFHTVAISRGAEKEALARKLGAHEYLDGGAPDFAKKLKAIGGAKVVIATAPNAKAIASVIPGMQFGGEVVIVAGSGEKLDLAPVQLLQRISVKGWVAQGPRDIDQTVRNAQLTGVESMVQTFPLEQAQAAYDAMMGATARFRSVLKISG